MAVVNDGRGVEIATRFRSSGSDRAFFALVEAAVARRPNATNSEKNEIAEISLWLSVTTVVKVATPDASDILRALADYWTWYTETIVDERGRLKTNDEALLAEAIDRFEDAVERNIAKLWRRAFNQAQIVYPAPIEAIHPSMLTPEQLASPELQGGAKSGGSDSGNEPAEPPPT